MKQALSIILIIIIIITGGRIFNWGKEHIENQLYYNNVQETVVQTVPTPTGEYTYKLTTTLQPPIAIDFSGLQQMNPDVIGWIYSDNTAISYPVLQGKDNVTYLHKRTDKSYSAAGSIFMDYRNNLTKDDNLIIYGHHMRDGSMFASLSNYAQQVYYEQHQTLWFLTPTQNYLIQPFAGLVIKATDTTYYNTIIEDKVAYINNAIALSTFAPTDMPTSHNQFITLSTCDYTYKNARYVLLGMLIPSI